MFTPDEQHLLELLRTDPIGYPFQLSDKQLEDIFAAIKRERGNHEQAARRNVRVWVAKRFNWKFAMDGGFMPEKGEVGYPNKYWQEGAWPFARVYRLFEDLVLHLLANGWTMEAIEAVYLSDDELAARVKQDLEEIIKKHKHSDTMNAQ